MAYEIDIDQMMTNLPENRPLYQDSGLWQVRTEDMEDVLFQQGCNETFTDFIRRVFNADNKLIWWGCNCGAN